MGRCTIFAALVLFAALPALAHADTPGGPPAVPPDCPPGTTLEGPYRHWRCAPVAPTQPVRARRRADAHAAARGGVAPGAHWSSRGAGERT